jgi:hypothetical protein
MDANQAATLAALAAGVSAITALVSVIALLVSVRLQWWSAHPHVKVVGTGSRLMDESGPIGKPRYCIDVRNTGSLPVVVKSVGVVFGRGSRFRRPLELGTITHARTALDEWVLPQKLEPGEDLLLTSDLNAVIKAYRDKGVVGVWARTGSGELYLGKNKVKLGTLSESPADS